MPRHPLVIKAFSKSHFGDTIAIFTEIKRLVEDGNEVLIADTFDNLYRYQMFRDVLDFSWKLTLTGSIDGFNVRFRDYKNIFPNKPIPTIIRHNPHPQKYNIITYSMDANFKKEEKINPEWNSIIGYGGVEWKLVGKSTKKPLLETVKDIALSDLYIGPDNGLAHINRGIGTPMIILEYLKSVRNIFVHENEYILCKSNEEIKKQVDRLVLDR